MKPRHRSRVGMLAAFVALGAAVCGFGCGSEGSRRVFLLPDGTTVRVIQVEWTTNAVATSSHATFSGWQASVARWLPRGAAERLGLGSTIAMSFGLPPGTNLTVVAAIARPAGTRWMLIPDRLRVRDEESGEIVVGAAGTCGVNGQIINTFVVPALPARSKTLEFSFLYRMDDEGRTNTASWIMPNPLGSDLADEMPDVLPARRKAGDVEVELVRVTRGPDRQDPTLERGILEFRALEAGEVSPHWLVESLQWVDRLAGTKPLFGDMDRDRPGMQWLLKSDLWSHRPSRVRASFLRTDRFPEAELWRTPSIPWPAGRESVRPDVSVMRAGAEVLVHSLTPPGVEVPAPFTGHSLEWRDPSLTTTLWTKGGGEVSGRHLTLVAAEDDRGRPVRFQDGDWPGLDHAFGLQAEDGTRSVRLTFAIQKNREVEFVLPPRSPRAGRADPGR